jgi:hypothetical protein
MYIKLTTYSTLKNTEYRTQNKDPHVHKTTYGPLIDTALYVMLYVGKSITWATGRGLALEISTGPNPIPLALIMDVARIKSITYWAV